MNRNSNANQGMHASESAIRFSGRDGEVVEIRVRDQGPGVPAEFVAQLFSKFARADIPNVRAKAGQPPRRVRVFKRFVEAEKVGGEVGRA